MRIYKKKEILQLIQVIKQVLKSLYIHQDFNEQMKADYFSELQRAAIAIGNEIERTEGEKNKAIKILEDYCEDVYQLSIENSTESYKKIIKRMEKEIDIVEKIILEDIKNDKLEVLFLPYKADMWTSLESIWKAAKQDMDAHVMVMPIPYFDIGNVNKVQIKYEAERFPKYVDIIDYKDYSLERNHPDIVFIHNPYDKCNTLTRVPACYYSFNIKKNCEILVYSPYFTVGSYRKSKYELMFTTPGVKTSDYIIAQSQYVKNIFQQYGCKEEKILSFGSPKIDAVVKNEQYKKEIPLEWKKKIEGKTVFLLNTHLSYFPKAYIKTNSLDNYAVKFHNEILETFLERDDCALIWRPHPLLKNMLQDKFPMCFEYIEYFENQIKNSSNAIIDENANYLVSFYCTNALISTWSSLINEYMVTGKPIMIFQRRMDEETERESPINRNLNYFRMGKNKLTFSQFRDNVINNIDPLYDIRKNAVATAFPNLNGDAGEKIYRYLKKKYKGE